MRKTFFISQNENHISLLFINGYEIMSELKILL
jgi:hypothetical protein